MQFGIRPDEQEDTKACPICGQEYHVSIGPACQHGDAEWRKLNEAWGLEMAELNDRRFAAATLYHEGPMW